MAAAVAFLGAGQAIAQVAPAGGGGTIVSTYLTITETITDNRDLRSTDKEADAVTSIRPGVRIASRSGRVRGSLDYSLNAQLYARDSSASEIQNFLSAAATAEVVESHAYLDVRASVGQQAISAFGVQSPFTSAVNANRTEVRTLNISPYVRGKIAGIVNVEAKAGYGVTDSSGRADRGDTQTSLALNLSGSAGLFGWGADASQQTSDFDQGRRTTTRRFGASLSARPDVDWRVALRLAREESDVLVAGTSARTSVGGSVDWTPTERTLFSVRGDRRYFGNAYGATAQHRWARSVFRYALSRDATSGSTVGLPTVTAYDLFFAQFASQFPDPIQRDIEVRRFLAANGIDPGAVTGGGFLTTGVSLQQRHELSWSMQFIRSTFIASVFRTNSRRLDRISTATDDLTDASVVRQQGVNLGLTHRLTPTTSVNVGLIQQRTLDAGNIGGNDQTSLSAGLTSQLGLRTSLAMTLRHVSFDSATRPYTENAASATLSLRF